MNKNTWIIGFTLFAMFFGAGNLIFPTQLGLESGHFFLASHTSLCTNGYWITASWRCGRRT